MNKNKKIIIIFSILAVITAFLLMKKPKDKSQLTIGDNSPNANDPIDTPVPVSNPKDTLAPIPVTNPTFPIKLGSRGNLVTNLQNIINFNDSAFNLNGGKYLVVDGNCGPATQARFLKVFGSPLVTESQYTKALDLYRKKIPYNSRQAETFPLYKGSYGNKVASLNEKLGVYPINNPYGKNFTAKTESALKAKYGVLSASAELYNRVVGSTPKSVWGLPVNAK